MKHHIERMIVDLYLNKQENAYELQQKVSQLFRKDLEKITDKVLSEYSDKRTTIHIPTLEIDLGNIRESHFELDFVKQYETELRKVIRAAVSKIETNPTYRRERQQTTQNTNPENAELSYLQDFNTQSVDENIIEILVFFLSFGRLPANASRDFDINTALQYALNHQKNLVIQRLKPLLKQQEIIHRLVYSFSETTANLFLSALLPNRFQAISTAIENATSVFSTSQFGTNQQKIQKKLLLISFELIQRNFIQKNKVEIDLTALNTSFLNVLPEQWKTAKTPIYETAFMAQKMQRINIEKLIQLPYSALVKTLQKAANRQFIIKNSSVNQREILLKILAQNHLQAIQKILDSFINTTGKIVENEFLTILSPEEKEKQRNIQEESSKELSKINQEKIINIVWSAIFEQFSKYETPDKIQIKRLERAIQDSLKQMKNSGREDESGNERENKSGKNTEQQAIYLVKRAEDILEIYLTEGYFIQNIGLNELIEKMLNTDAVQLRFLLNRIAKTVTAQNRLTKDLSLKNLEKVLKILVYNIEFIQTIQGLISETQQIILLQNVIQQQLKYGKIDAILTLDEFFQSVEFESLPPNFLDNLIQQSTTETTQIFITDYFAAETVINPIGESEVPELFEATRFLDYFHQYFNQNTMQNKGEIWWTKTISIDDLNQNFQSIISIYPNEIKNIFNAFLKQKNISTALIDLLNQNNLTVLMNLIEPNIFGFISTMILTAEEYTSINKAWEITLKSYFSTPKPFSTHTFTQQVLLLLAQELKQSYQETIEEILVYSNTQIKNNQHRYHALKHIIQQDIRMKNIPQLLIKSMGNEEFIDNNIDSNQNTNKENLLLKSIKAELLRLKQKLDAEITSNQNAGEENLLLKNIKAELLRLKQKLDAEITSNQNAGEENLLLENVKAELLRLKQKLDAEITPNQNAGEENLLLKNIKAELLRLKQKLDAEITSNQNAGEENLLLENVKAELLRLKQKLDAEITPNQNAGEENLLLENVKAELLRLKQKLDAEITSNQNAGEENLLLESVKAELLRLKQKLDAEITSNQNAGEESLLLESVKAELLRLKQKLDAEITSNQNIKKEKVLDTTNLEEEIVNKKIKIDKKKSPLPIEIISYFLKYGTLPIAQNDLTEANFIEIIKKQGFENLNLLKVTAQKLLKNTVSNRQLKQISEPILIELIKVLQPKIGLSVLDIYADFKMVVEVGVLKTSMLELIGKVRVFNQKSNFEKHYIHTVLTNLANNFNYTYETALTAIITEFEGKKPKSKVVKQLRLISVRLAEQEKNETIENKPVPVVEQKITTLKDTAIYIENSGIVILSVFLPHLFNMFKFIENKKFKDMETACRAAYMIHFITTGRTEPMEHELVLSKIICNIPLGQPINAVISLTEEEIEGCKQLMKAAIGRWEKLKNSSIEGFRNSFIAREGKLLKTSKGWSLAVEQKPFDLLLKTLPWGMTMVHFSWMDEAIYVDWAY